MFTACSIFDTRRNDIFITDKDYYEIKRQYSPVKTKLLLTYGLDQGATGQGEVGTAILNLTDTLKNIQPFTIAWHLYNNCQWLNDDTVIVYLDYLRKMRQNSGVRRYFDTASINGVQIKYDYKDLIDSTYKRDTLLSQLSPDKQNRLIVYRYNKRNNLNENFLNISVTKSSDTLPQYGNFFISDIKNDYIYYCKWSNTNKLLLYTTSSCQYIIENYLVQNRLGIQTELKIKDDVLSPFRWTEKNSY